MRKYVKAILEEKKDLEKEIFNFLRENPKPKDSEYHALADKLGIDPDELEAVAYSMLGAIISGGKSKGEEKDFDAEEVKLGMKVEMEHTSNSLLAKKIVYDHLTDNSKYYSEGKKKGIFDELK